MTSASPEIQARQMRPGRAHSIRQGTAAQIPANFVRPFTASRPPSHVDPGGRGGDEVMRTRKRALPPGYPVPEWPGPARVANHHGTCLRKEWVCHLGSAAGECHVMPGTSNDDRSARGGSAPLVLRKTRMTVAPPCQTVGGWNHAWTCSRGVLEKRFSEVGWVGCPGSLYPSKPAASQ